MRRSRFLALVLIGAAAAVGILSVLVVGFIHQEQEAERRCQEEHLAREVARCMRDLASAASDEIYLYKMRRTDEFLEHFCGRADIHSIILEDTDISEAGMAQIRSALPQCDVKLQGWEPSTERP